MKLHLLKELLDLNQALEQVLTGLERMEGSRFFHREEFRYMRAEIESVRVHANREFFGRFDDIVEKDAQWAYKFRRAYDKKTTDPFDLYLEIKEREDARRKKGLPPRVVLLPDWDTDDEQRYDEEHARKRTAYKRRREMRNRKSSSEKLARQPKAGVGPVPKRTS
jgi:hypothetical protein